VPYYWKRLVIRDHRRNVVLGREPSLEGQYVNSEVYLTADEAMPHAIAASRDMDFESELVEGEPPR
jgi:hypothetical protein